MNMKNIRLSVKQKVLIFTLSAVAIALVIALSYLGGNSQTRIRKASKQLADSQTREYAAFSKGKLSRYMDATRHLQENSGHYRHLRRQERTAVIDELLKKTLRNYGDLASVWVHLDLSKMAWPDSLTMSKGSEGNTFARMFQRYNGTIQEKGATDLSRQKIYNRVMDNQSLTVAEPGANGQNVLNGNNIPKAHMAAPVMDQDRLVGVVGVDIPLSALQKEKDYAGVLSGSTAFLVSPGGILMSFPDKNYLGQPVQTTSLAKDQEFNLQNRIAEGKSFMGRNHYFSLAPVHLEGTNTTWYAGQAVPHQAMTQSVGAYTSLAWIIGLAGLILTGIVVWYTSGQITQSIRKITGSVNHIADGSVDHSSKLDIRSGDEIEEMAATLNRYMDGYIDKTEFASSIGQGNLEVNLQLMSENDHLGQSLLQIRDSLKQAREEAKKREEEEQKRRWANEGVAKFADLLRKDNDNLEKLSYTIISNLVQYLEANQGGIFLLNDQDEQDPLYELTAAYAFDRKKYLNKKIKPGEGLVGSCVLEEKTKYLTEIPQDYINITSGLGDTNPDSLLIVPLKTDEEVLGVLEIASFGKFEQYQIDFVEKVAESIASTISSAKINLKTNQLLEKSQQQAEEMKSQEEEMRQNMEEMQSTQEELSRKVQDNEAMQKELAKEKALLDALMNNLPDYIYFKDRDSKFIRISKSMLPLFPVDSVDEMIGKSDFDFHKPEAAKEMYNEEQEIISKEKGFQNKTQHEYTETGKEQWVSVTKLPLYDEQGNLIGTFGLSKDITPYKELEIDAQEKNRKLEERVKELDSIQQKAALKENEMEGLSQVIDQLLWRADLDGKGYILSVNHHMSQQTGSSEDELKGKHIGSLLGDPKQFDQEWNKVMKNQTRKDRFKFARSSGEKADLQVSLIPVTDKNNKISKVLFIGYDLNQSLSS